MGLLVRWRIPPLKSCEGFPREGSSPSPGIIESVSYENPVFPQKAAIQIYETIKKKKKHAYITKRWRLIAWALKLLPDFIYEKL